MGTQLPSPKRGQSFSAPNFRPTSIVVKRLHGSRCHLVLRYASGYATLCSMWTQLPSENRHIKPTQFLAHVYCGQMAGRIKTPLRTEVDLGPGHNVLDGAPLTRKGHGSTPLFGPCLLWPPSPSSATAELLYNYPYLASAWHNFEICCLVVSQFLCKRLGNWSKYMKCRQLLQC